MGRPQTPSSSSVSSTEISDGEPSSNIDYDNDDPFIAPTALLPAPPPSLSSGDESLPVPSSCSSLSEHSVSNSGSSVSSAEGSRFHDSQSQRQQIAKDIAKLECKIQEGEKQQELLKVAADVARQLGEGSLAERIRKLYRKIVVRVELLRRVKTTLKREARAKLATRNGLGILDEDQVVDRRKGSALERPGDEADGGRSNEDRTLEWLKGLSRAAGDSGTTRSLNMSRRDMAS